MDIPPDYIKKKRLNLKNSARRRQIKFSCSREYLEKLISNPVCFYSGISLTLENLTTDRLNCNRGYEEDNIVLSCDKINELKGTIEFGEFIPFGLMVRKIGKKAADNVIRYARLKENRRDIWC